MGAFMVCRISHEGEIEEFYYNSYIAAVNAIKDWERQCYECKLYAQIRVAL